MSANSSSQGPKTVTAVKTAVFKLHNPTQRKRAMLDNALLHNHLAYTKALKAAIPLVQTLVETELHGCDWSPKVVIYSHGLLPVVV
jgi:hypothetical protein